MCAAKKIVWQLVQMLIQSDLRVVDIGGKFGQVIHTWGFRFSVAIHCEMSVQKLGQTIE